MNYELRFIERYISSPQYGGNVDMKSEALQYRTLGTGVANIDRTEYIKTWSEWKDVPHVKLEK